jgi:hypothetical protein
MLPFGQTGKIMKSVIQKGAYFMFKNREYYTCFEKMC